MCFSSCIEFTRSLSFCVNPQVGLPKPAVHVQLVCHGVVTTSQAPYMEDYIHSGLQDDEWKECTERLQTWNHPRKRNTEPKPTDDVHMVRKEYGIRK